MEDNKPVYDFEEAVEFILARMMDRNRPYSERFPEEIMWDGCLCKRLVETILYWDEQYMISKGIMERAEEDLDEG